LELPMLGSIRFRAYASTGLALAVLVLLGALIALANEHTRTAFHWVSHTQEVIVTLDGVVANLSEAESGQRGYLLTRSASFLGPFDHNVAQSDRLARRLVLLVEDNPAQSARVAALHRSTAAKIATMREVVALARDGSFDRAITLVAAGGGKRRMEEVVTLVDEIRDAEQHLLQTRNARAAEAVDRTQSTLLYGAPAAAALLLWLLHLIVTRVSGPLLELHSAASAIGEGRLDARVTTSPRGDEFDSVGRAFNRMAEHLAAATDQQRETDAALQSANEALVERGAALEAHGAAITLLANMAHRMQAADSDQEFADVLGCFVPQVLPGMGGALYKISNSRNLLTRLAVWGEATLPETFAPRDCWALRRGQSHSVHGCDEHGIRDVVCDHARRDGPLAYQCEPVLAGSEVIGLLYIDGRIADDQRFRLSALAENIALALMNFSLRERLKEQSIRDPLTQLFNRRYMEEALATETARALRTQQPIGVIMADVDHFKRFNDAHGHEAGDALLRDVARLIRAQFRDGDIVCRYGGEEFTVIAPGADADLLHTRAEQLRLAIKDLMVEHRGQQLGPVTMSQGIAIWNAANGGRPDELVQAADAALYRAKRRGRDRVEDADDAVATAPKAPKRLPPELVLAD
jgi:diguanylate cyclase (GGDEF)-like protein